MTCDYKEYCGGCICRELSWDEYKNRKVSVVKKILCALHQEDYTFAEPIFVGDGQRRRAAFAFEYKKGHLTLGFNQAKSETIIDISACTLLTASLNKYLPDIKNLITEICKVSVPVVNKKGKRIGVNNLDKGDVLVCDADNGLDILLEFSRELNLDYRMIISELANACPAIVRVSHRRQESDAPETVVEKAKPYIDIAGYQVFIPAGTFLQASKASEKALIDIVLRYVGETSGKVADLFCGVGTFSYPLSKNPANQIIAADSSKPLLEGFRQSLNKNMISNIQIIEKNLFKYPLDERELNGFEIVVFDPPRAGATAQAEKLAALPFEKRPQKIIAVSCNPHSLVNDANVLIDADYKLQEITLVDQFTYSNHSELVALFTK